MRGIMVGVLVAGCAAGGAAGRAQEEYTVTRATIQAERRQIVAETMQLDPSVNDEFWKLHDAYRDDMNLVNERFNKLLDDYASSYETLTDQQAGALLEEWLEIEREVIDVKKRWVRRFGRKLPERLVVRFFQLDNKLDMVVRAELARIVPLAR